MKTRKAMLALALLAAAIIASAPASRAYTPGAGMLGTPHDWWTKGSTATVNGTAYRYGMCTRCHTPHKAVATQLLWNHTLSTNTFQWDAPSTTAGTPYPTFHGDTYKGPTTKCLSCHDGSVASSDINWFHEAKPTVSAFTPKTLATAGGINIGVTGKMGYPGQSTHPVAMPYPYGQAQNSYNGVTTGASATWTEWVSDPTGSGIRLFNDDGAGVVTAGAVATKTGIECTSCHDVHNGAQVQDQRLLRGLLTGSTSSYLCNKCHIKDH